MSTTLAKPAEMADRKWYVIDAAGKPLGRVAAKAAVILRGKNKTTFTPNVDCGDNVIIINCDEAVLTGKKLELPIKKLLLGQPLEKIVNPDTMANPECLTWYGEYATRRQQQSA